jgi:hypothetical protein
METKIYILIDPRDNQIRYLGKTTQQISKRYNTHISTKGTSKKANWIKTLKEQNLKPLIKVIDTVTNDWEFWEEYWISNLKLLGFDLLNQTLGGEGQSGYSPSEETRKKWSIAFTGRKMSKEWRERISKGISKEITAYSLSGEFIGNYKNAVIAARVHNMIRSHICTCCKGNQKSAGSLVFRYLGEPFDKFEVERKSKRKILQLDENENVIKEWSSIKEAADFYNVKSPNISRCLRGIRNRFRKCYWKYKD